MLAMHETIPCSRGHIKGNLNASGERIRHLPGNRDCPETDIDESRGER
jgi:hypothetical protein